MDRSLFEAVADAFMGRRGRCADTPTVEDLERTFPQSGAQDSATRARVARSIRPPTLVDPKREFAPEPEDEVPRASAG